MRVLGIDPGTKRTGWAVHDDAVDSIIASGVMRGEDFLFAKEILDTYHPSVIACEDQYVRKHTRVNKNGVLVEYIPSGIQKLIRLAGSWEAIAAIDGLRFELVNSSTWQSYFKIKKGDKDAICRIASQIAGREMQTDEADAALIAYYWASINKFNEAIKAADSVGRSFDELSRQRGVRLK